MDYSLTNYNTCLNFQNYFPVFKNFVIKEDGTLSLGDKVLSLKNFDIREIYFESNNLFADHLKSGKLSANKIFNIFKIYENKNIYLEHESDFYKNFGSENDFIDKYNNYYYSLLVNSDYLTEELRHFLTIFATRISFIQNNPSYTDNPRLVKEVDFWNNSLLKIESTRDKENNGKSNTLRKSLNNGNADYSGYEEDIEEDYLSKTGYVNIFLQTLLILGIGISLGSILLIKIIS